MLDLEEGGGLWARVLKGGGWLRGVL